jgi:hypothetical protein
MPADSAWASVGSAAWSTWQLAHQLAAASKAYCAQVCPLRPTCGERAV